MQHSGHGFTILILLILVIANAILMNTNTFRWATVMASVCLMMLVTSGAVTARSNRMNDSLAAISRQLFAERNEYFILVEAIKDGFIEDEKPFSILYSEKGIMINGNSLTQADENRYHKLMQDFYANGSTSAGLASWTMEGDSLSLDGDILNPTSNYRTRGPWHHTNRKPSKQLIIEELTRDKLAETTRPIHLRYTQKALVVNGNTLSPAMADKYKMLIRILEGFEPLKETDIYSINR